MKKTISILFGLLLVFAAFGQGIIIQTNYSKTVLTAGGDSQLNANGQEFDPSGAAWFVWLNLGNGGVATMTNAANQFTGAFYGNATTATMATTATTASNASGTGSAVLTNDTRAVILNNTANQLSGALLNFAPLIVTNYSTVSGVTYTNYYVMKAGSIAVTKTILLNTNNISVGGSGGINWFYQPYTNSFNNFYHSSVSGNNYLTNISGMFYAYQGATLHATNSTGFATTNWVDAYISPGTPLTNYSYTYYTLVTNTTTTINGGGSLSNTLAITSFTFPATTATWTNPISSSIAVFVDNSGVTLSAVALNGTTIFSLANDLTLTLQPNEYFSETYTIGTPVGHWKPLP